MKDPQWETASKQSVLFTALVNEYCVMAGRGLAYKYSKVRATFPHSGVVTGDVIATTISDYEATLRAVQKESIIESVHVDMKSTQWDANSHLKKNAVYLVGDFTKRYAMTHDLGEYMLSMMREEYNYCELRVKRSIVNAINIDWHQINAIAVTPAVLLIPVQYGPVAQINYDAVIASSSVATLVTVTSSPAQIEWDNLIASIGEIADYMEETRPAYASVLMRICDRKRYPSAYCDSNPRVYSALKRATYCLLPLDLDDLIAEYSAVYHTTFETVSGAIGLASSGGGSIMM